MSQTVEQATSVLAAANAAYLSELERHAELDRNSMEATDEIYQILRDAKVLARRYYQLTGKPLGVTGEIAEYEAARILNLELELARQAGYDATELRDGLTIRVQIKGRYFPRASLRGGRLGAIDLRQPFDSVLLVLLDADYNAFQIYEAQRPAVETLLTRPGSKARNERGSVGISQFKAISTLRWARPISKETD
jgi:hypothetical protein